MNRCRLKKSTSLYRSYRIIGIKTCFVHASKQILYFTLCFSRHKSEWFETQREMGSITKRRDELRNLFAFPRGSIVIKSHTRSEKADKCFWCFCHRVCCCSLLCFFLLLTHSLLSLRYFAIIRLKRFVFFCIGLLFFTLSVGAVEIVNH